MNSIHNHLKDYTQNNIYPFHMPGHKRNPAFLSFDTDPVTIDVTEVSATDNLQSPTGIIYDAQVKAAEIFGTEQSYLLANGATGGVIAAILSAVPYGGSLIMARNSHMSAYSAVTFGGLHPTYVYPQMTNYGIAGSIPPACVEEAFKKTPEASAIFITSPTYEGIVSDIETIAKIAHAHNAVLIVDEAHGSHMRFHDAFPKSALELGADIVIHSLHKTLPSLTQTALLHTKGDRCDHRLIRQFLNMINSSSPSYILLSSIGKCLDFLESGADDFEKYAERLSSERSRISELKNISLIDKTCINNSFDYDISKIVLATNDGNELERELLEKYSLQMEMSSDNIVLAMTSVADTEDGFKRLMYALNELDNFHKKVDKKHTAEYPIPYPKPVEMMSIRDAIYSKTKKLPLQKSIGKISTENITPYPPGLPICLPGELISTEILEFLPKNFAMKEITVVG